ncbi:MAG: phosphonate C-P lyase system protein PhnH [Desulfobacterales bacterium]
MTGALDSNYSSWGFDDPEHADQQTFRAMVKALDHPGHPVQLKSKLSVPGDLNPASAALLLMLCHGETTVWADLSWDFPIIEWFQCQCGCTLVTEPCMASLALITKPSTMPPLEHFRIGDYERPETASSLIIQVTSLSAATPMNSTPAVANQARLRSPMEEVPAKFWTYWYKQSIRHPPGLDIFFTCDDILAVLPPF